MSWTQGRLPVAGRFHAASTPTSAPRGKPGNKIARPPVRTRDVPVGIVSSELISCHRGLRDQGYPPGLGLLLHSLGKLDGSIKSALSLGFWRQRIEPRDNPNGFGGHAEHDAIVRHILVATSDSRNHATLAHGNITRREAPTRLSAQSHADIVATGVRQLTPIFGPF